MRKPREKFVSRGSYGNARFSCDASFEQRWCLIYSTDIEMTDPKQVRAIADWLNRAADWMEGTR